MEPHVSRDHAFKVLVVEDESLIAMELCMVLEERGYEVVGPAATVADGLAIVRQGVADACVLDLNLRGESSYPIAEALREHGVPFVLSTAYQQGTFDQPAFKDIVNIGKPASTALLLSMLASLRRPA
jgi:CheY-like chemotaxis protein